MRRERLKGMLGHGAEKRKHSDKTMNRQVDRKKKNRFGHQVIRQIKTIILIILVNIPRHLDSRNPGKLTVLALAILLRKVELGRKAMLTIFLL